MVSQLFPSYSNHHTALGKSPTSQAIPLPFTYYFPSNPIMGPRHRRHISQRKGMLIENGQWLSARSQPNRCRRSLTCSSDKLHYRGTVSTTKIPDMLGGYLPPSPRSLSTFSADSLIFAISSASNLILAEAKFCLRYYIKGKTISTSSMKESQEIVTNFDRLSSRNGHDILALGEKPCECYLTRCRIVFLSNLRHIICELQNLREILLAEPVINATKLTIQLWSGTRKIFHTLEQFDEYP